MSSRGMTKTNLDNKWHRLDGTCRALGDTCPKKANDELGKAATSLFQSNEYPKDAKHFLGLATQSLHRVETLLRSALE
jgi:hypothetical protein